MQESPTLLHMCSQEVQQLVALLGPLPNYSSFKRGSSTLPEIAQAIFDATMSSYHMHSGIVL